ncbi:MAG: signal peptidase I [Nanohaloarchaea archaeon SW_7_43_1]|nr:MAG: signal peptidase I [Nanohaloarchaea archaeon SW_7_43_1]
MDAHKSWNDLKESKAFKEFYFVALALILAFGIIQTTGVVFDTEKPVVTVVSCSMYPEYNVGDVILVQGQSFEEIEEGDVVVYDSESPEVNIPIIHRVILKTDDHIETQGDNTRGQHDFEKDIGPDQIYGKTAFSIPRVGLVKILAMDLFGYSGDEPLSFDSTPACRRV